MIVIPPLSLNMSKLYFFFYVALLLICMIFSGIGDINLKTQLAISLLFVLLVGIPHGAIDHLLVKQEGIKNPIKFYTFYIGMLMANIIIWMTFPILGLCSFLIISAYHFGQSQFASFHLKKTYIRKTLYFMWGISILSGLIYYNLSEVNIIITQSEDFSTFLNVPDAEFLRFLLISTSLASILMLFSCRFLKSISTEQLLIEILFLGLIHLCFFLLPILIGFTLYFIVLHSIKVLIEEFEYLKGIKANLGFKQFIIKLLPYTLLSIIGGLLLFTLNFMGYLYMSSAFILLVVISSITLPHSIVMEGFYHQDYSKSKIV